ncbi:MAG: hypothetical protein A2912_00415 [Candidatus Buchananbacteria bacterium RIFCSPLOWO2_01_FULL_40_23b]|uniref:Transposase DDE domain-containing protein n=1 Tax=Candidatus Buchananbacteria bacterium RIFCSPLOWO2_01_FULL_40_23b TaxID=1797544 RepID=A0A1G1YQV7_9BACT|nr:MAG: hypothetical protein A2912_00415 [Candidatus Buchananbacteria bacterium RIFCSPLOWO2_01_FULL_40_23b]
MLLDEDIILHLFCEIADGLRNTDRKHVQGKLYLSEIVLCGALFVLHGTSFRRFHVWLMKQSLFPKLPERSRLLRLMNHYDYLCEEFLGSKTFFGILDSFGIEIIHPIREGRSKQSQQVSKKGKSNHRWIIGRKVAVTMNQHYEVVTVSEETANVCDHDFNGHHAESAAINLTDHGFKDKEGIPASFKICKKGSWNERMLIETLFSLWTRICNMKKSFHRTVKGFRAKISYLVTLTNIIIRKNEELGFARLSMVQWSL